MTDPTDVEATTELRVERRRTFHAYPEPSWCEFLTTSRLVDHVEAIGVDALHVGRDVIDPEYRLGVPDEGERVRIHGAAKNWYNGHVSVALTGWTTIHFPKRGRWWEA